MALIPQKTPVSILQELLSRRGTTPKYELVQIEGAIHEPTFRYRVTVADTVGEGYCLIFVMLPKFSAQRFWLGVFKLDS